MSRKTAAAVTALLVGVTEHGTGRQALIDGYRVAGKTGTAQKVDPGTGRYSPRDRMSSFIGFAPAENPALVVLVVLLLFDLRPAQAFRFGANTMLAG